MNVNTDILVRMEEGLFEKQERGGEKKREALEKEANSAISRDYEKMLAERERMIQEHPVFVSNQREYPIRGTADMRIARVQYARKTAEGIREEKRKEGDYFSEKGAAKLAEFLESQEKFLLRLEELRRYYPELAGTIEYDLFSFGGEEHENGKSNNSENERSDKTGN